MPSSQQSPLLSESAVFSLLEFADSKLRTTGTFDISLEDLCARLGIPQVDAYRALYGCASALSGYLPERFDLENINLLSLFLSLFSDIDVESIFRTAGARLNSDDLSELAALYYDTASGAIAAHTPQKEEYRQMYARFKTSRRSFEVYKDHFFDSDQVFESTVSDFVSARRFTFPALGRSSVRRSLTLLFERHIISVAGIFEGLYEQLTGENYHGADKTGGSRGGRVESSYLQMLRTLGLSRAPADLKELRLHYKALMKTYHPDVNPEGLEISKKINAAYAELVSSWSQSH